MACYRVNFTFYLKGKSHICYYRRYERDIPIPYQNVGKTVFIIALKSVIDDYMFRSFRWSSSGLPSRGYNITGAVHVYGIPVVFTVCLFSGMRINKCTTPRGKT